MAQVSSPARQFGQYYTPSFLVEVMLRLALDPLLKSRRPQDAVPLSILDPASGEGAFLVAAARHLAAWYDRHGMPSDHRPASHLFGVDIDRTALATLRSRLMAPRGESPRWDSQLRWGDALTGPGFGETTEPASPKREETPTAADLDWATAFPRVAGRGGFDLVIGNPPYRRERTSKEALERLKASPLGKKWHRARLDLWAYFLHRGLDLLRPGGRLAFVLPSYWTASTAARPLIDRLEAETTLREVILLGRSPVFPNVEGWHLVLSLVKEKQSDPCRVWDLTSSGKRIAADLAAIPAGKSASYLLDRGELFQHGQLGLSPPDHRLRSLRSPGGSMLQERFDVRQGIVENPRRITGAIAAESAGRFQRGEGVFVLSAEELCRLELSSDERKLLRPYYRGTDIERFQLSAQPEEHLLYLTRETAPAIEAFPNIAAHLARFRPLLENRREVRRGRIAWWHLHWPREEALFLAPRILMPQMGYAPRFVHCERPAFVGFAMHIIRLRSSPGDDVSANALLALTGMLCSELAARWFRRFAKHRGAALDISGTLLKRFPLPREDAEAEAALARLVQCRQELPAGSARIPDGEAEIERLVERWYGLS